MITKALMGLLAVIVGLIDAIVPSLEIPFLDELHDAAEWAGAQVAFVDPILPVEPIVDVATWTVATYVPVWFTFVTVRWVYAHVPVFGAGA